MADSDPFAKYTTPKVTPDAAPSKPSSDDPFGKYTAKPDTAAPAEPPAKFVPKNRIEDAIRRARAKAEAEAPTLGGDLADVGRSALAVPGKVATGLVATPRTLEDLGAAATNWAGRAADRIRYGETAGRLMNEKGDRWKYEAPAKWLPTYEDTAGYTRGAVKALTGYEGEWGDLGATIEGKTPWGQAVDFAGPMVGAAGIGGISRAARTADSVLSGLKTAAKVTADQGIIPSAAAAVPHYLMADDNPNKQAWEIATGLVSGARPKQFKKPNARLTDQAATAVENADLYKEFNVDPTHGQLTGDILQQAKEAAMLRGGVKNPDLAHAMSVGMEAQQAQMKTAKEGILGGITPPDEAGEAAMAGIRRKAGEFKTEAKANYQIATGINPGIDLGAINQAGNRVRQYLKDQGLQADFKLANHPNASKALTLIDDYSKSIGGKDPLKFTLHAYDEVRKEVKGLFQGDPTDRMFAQHVARGFDEWFNETVDNKLLTGNPADVAEAIKALREARPAWKAYKDIVSAKHTDDAGKLIAKMASPEREITGQGAANWMFGVNTLGGLEGQVYRVASRMKGILGDTSNEWKGVRQGAWRNIIHPLADEAPGFGPQALAKRIRKFTGGEGKALASVLFSPDEIEKMNHFANLLDTQIPKPGAVNYSGTEMARARTRTERMGRAAGSLVAFLGAAAGLEHFGVSGQYTTAAAASAITYASVKIGDKLREHLKDPTKPARQAFNPDIKKLSTPPPTRRDIWRGAGPAKAGVIGTLGRDPGWALYDKDGKLVRTQKGADRPTGPTSIYPGGVWKRIETVPKPTPSAAIGIRG